MYISEHHPFQTVSGVSEPRNWLRLHYSWILPSAWLRQGGISRFFVFFTFTKIWFCSAWAIDGQAVSTSSWPIHIVTWVHNYLADCKQRVVLNGESAEDLKIMSGVPQQFILVHKSYCKSCSIILYTILQYNAAIWLVNQRYYKSLIIPLIQLIIPLI